MYHKYLKHKFIERNISVHIFFFVSHKLGRACIILNTQMINIPTCNFKYKDFIDKSDTK